MHYFLLHAAAIETYYFSIQIRLEKEQLEKNASDFTLKLKAADQSMETMQLKENELKRNFEVTKIQRTICIHGVTC